MVWPSRKFPRLQNFLEPSSCCVRINLPSLQYHEIYRSLVRLFLTYRSCKREVQIYSLLFICRFFIDDTPIRVFNNYTNYGVPYPTQPMRIEAALWTADWATFGHKINWTYAPFVAHYQGFDISGCSAQNSDVEECYSSNHWWNNMEYWNLNSTQQKAYENVRKKYMNYDYCDDKAMYPSGLPRECVIQKNGQLHNGQKY